MKSTSEKIIDTSLDLFNTLGLSQVTLRTIAKELGMSQGNLNYHFKKRDDIIEAIYYRLVADMDASMAKVDSSKIGLQLLYDISVAVMTNTFKYRFFFLDFIQIMRENEKINTHYKKLIELRASQMTGLFGVMVSEGLLRAEQLNNEYHHLYKRTQIFSDFWMTSAEIENKTIEKSTIDQYLETITQSIFPYLTEKGIEEYKTLEL
jgi:AcrR family transcriptional regulator